VRGLLRALAWLGGAALALPLAALVVWFGGMGPWGPFPGGVLWGETAREQVADWSFVDRVAEVEVQTWLGPLPWTVTTWALRHEGRLYLPSRNCFEKRWVRNLLANPDVRVRIEGRVHELRAVRDEDAAVGEALLRQALVKYLGIEAEDPRLLAHAPGPGETRAYGCIFRMERRA
jgi:hypothetical protein